MLWLAIHLPSLPLDALPARLTPCPTGRCVVDDGEVVAVDESAHAQGVQCGLSPATAAALAPQVRQCPREPSREAAFVHDLALALSVLTPQVVLEPDGVLLEVHGSLRLFGGVRTLLRRAADIARVHGACARLGLAPTAQGARLLSRCPQRQRRTLRTTTSQRLLNRLPLPAALAALAQPLRLADMLQAIGARTVGDVRALPRGGLQRRGGGPLLRTLDQAFGEAPDPRRWFEPPAQFSAELELMHRADDAVMLGHAAERLVHVLAGWLSRHWLAASRLHLVLRHEPDRHGLPDTVLPIELSQASRDAAHLMVVLHERLQRLVLAAPAYGLRLVLDAAQSCAGHPGHLLPEAGQHEQDFHALLDRLRARLGAGQVRHLALHADHRPEQAYTIQASALPGPSRQADAAAPTPSSAPRPLWLLPAPVPLAEHSGRPLHGTQPLTVLTRAERIEAGWFDGALVCRDYHIAEGSDHRLRWIYRERRGSRRGQPLGWYLHGLFG